MAVLTGAEYRESLKALSPEVYIRGKRVEEVVGHPLLKQTINHMSSIAEPASNPEDGKGSCAGDSRHIKDYTREKREEKLI